jgi:DNA-binding transcriptional ArsR family regulator
MLITTFYAVIGDNVTYRIALLIAKYALNVSELCAALRLPQSRVSHKLAKLRKYGCVSYVREGRKVTYRLNEPCRSILLKGDQLWRKMNPEYSMKWLEDLDLLAVKLSHDLESREIHPCIE